MHKILLVKMIQVIRQQVRLTRWGFEVVFGRRLYGVLSLFVQSEPHLVLMWMVCLFLMVTTGAGKFARFQGTYHVSVIERSRLWISSWRRQ